MGVMSSNFSQSFEIKEKLTPIFVCESLSKKSNILVHFLDHTQFATQAEITFNGQLYFAHKRNTVHDEYFYLDAVTYCLDIEPIDDCSLKKSKYEDVILNFSNDGMKLDSVQLNAIKIRKSTCTGGWLTW